MATTLFEKIWADHVVVKETPNTPAILYVDFHLLNEVTSPQAFDELATRGIRPVRPENALAVIDHSTPTLSADGSGRRPYVSAQAEQQVAVMGLNAESQGIRFLGWEDPHRGIVHVVGPELGLTLPGMTIVCGDSHTSTHGAFGALAFGIGTSEVTQVLATQCLLQRRPRTMRITISGSLPVGCAAKDIALHVVTQVGAGGGAGYVIEFAGDSVDALSMEERMTLCNMTIECGARAGFIAPDEKTVEWLRRCPELPEDFESRVEGWLAFKTDADAVFDNELHLDISSLEPMITWGITPDTAVAVTGSVPRLEKGDSRVSALNYMGLRAGEKLIGTPIDFVFIGSCTNARLSDLRVVANVLRGRRIAKGITLLVVPGSETVRRAAEAEGLHDVILAAGGQWRLAGCSMCLGMNGDLVPAGKLVISTSNRNFMGRQGPGARTMLASPATAAASAIHGVISDPRECMHD